MMTPKDVLDQLQVCIFSLEIRQKLSNHQFDSCLKLNLTDIHVSFLNY